MQNLETFSPLKKHEVLSNLLCRDIALEYNGTDLPSGVVPPTIIEGKIKEVLDTTFIFEFKDGTQAVLSITEVIGI